MQAMPSPIGQSGSMYRRGPDQSQSRGTFNMPEFSAIAPDESENFLSRQEKEDLFGATLKPDQMKIPMAQTGNFSVMTAENMEGYAQMQGEFKIERGFAGMDRAQMFSVCNP